MPNRILKESICTSESINQLSDFEENLFYKLIVNCDDYGRFDGRPAIIKARCYPLRERLTLKIIESALLQLASIGCIELYEVDGKSYLCLPSWEVHQQVRAKKSKFPAPDSNGYQMISDDCKCPRNPIQSESLSESLSVRSRDMRGEPANTPRFTPPTADDVREYCRDRRNDVDPEKFVDFYASKGWLVGKVKMRDWKACVRTWEKGDNHNGGNSPQKSSNPFLRDDI